MAKSEPARKPALSGKIALKPISSYYQGYFPIFNLTREYLDYHEKTVPTFCQAPCEPEYYS